LGSFTSSAAPSHSDTIKSSLLDDLIFGDCEDIRPQPEADGILSDIWNTPLPHLQEPSEPPPTPQSLQVSFQPPQSPQPSHQHEGSESEIEEESSTTPVTAEVAAMAATKPAKEVPTNSFKPSGKRMNESSQSQKFAKVRVNLIIFFFLTFPFLHNFKL
jgi:hypothetical protein